MRKATLSPEIKTAIMALAIVTSAMQRQGFETVSEEAAVNWSALHDALLRQIREEYPCADPVTRPDAINEAVDHFCNIETAVLNTLHQLDA